MISYYMWVSTNIHHVEITILVDLLNDMAEWPLTVQLSWGINWAGST